jgi:tetratricopeptide (TPR) repeat protein
MQNPESDKAVIAKSLELEQSYRIPEAIALIAEARRKNSPSRALAIRHGHLFLVAKQPEHAMQMFQSLSDADPDHKEPMLRLGVAKAQLALKQFDAAAEAFEQMNAELPANIDVMCGLAAIRREQGRLDEAAAFVDRALQMNPKHRAAIHQKAQVQMARGETDAAIATLESNALREDQFGDSLDLWLDTLRNAKRDRYMQEKLEECAARWPHKVEFIFGLGVQAHRAGEVSKARPAFEKADKLSPDNWRILHEWGVMERLAGDIKKSQELIHRALLLNPEQPAALRTFGTEHKYAYGDTEFTRLNFAAAKLADVEPIEQVHLHYAVGKAFEDVNELDTAFRHYEMAGVKKRRLEKYDERNAARMFALMPQVVNPKAYEAYHQKGHDSDVPVFILGMPRSGTSLLEQILSSHPDIFGAGELKLLSPAIDNIRYGNNRLNLNETEPAFPYEMDAGWDARGKWYAEKIQALADKPYKRIVDKMPGNFTLTPLIKAILPNARIIHSRRHPVETCLSNYRIHFQEGQLWSYNLRELGRYYKRYWQLMQSFRENYPGMMHEVRYEDNVADVEGQARRLIDFLGLPWYEGVLEFYNTDRPVKTASATQVRKPIYKTSTNRWRKFEKYLAPLLDELGDVVDQYEAEIAHLSGDKQ